jgi:hypothetical protein
MVDPSGYKGLKPLVCKRGNGELYVELLARGRYSVSHDQARSIMDMANGEYIMQGKEFKFVSGKLVGYLVSPGAENGTYVFKATNGEVLQCKMVERILRQNNRRRSR